MYFFMLLYNFYSLRFPLCRYLNSAKYKAKLEFSRSNIYLKCICRINNGIIFPLTFCEHVKTKTYRKPFQLGFKNLHFDEIINNKIRPLSIVLMPSEFNQQIRTLCWRKPAKYLVVVR